MDAVGGAGGGDTEQELERARQALRNLSELVQVGTWDLEVPTMEMVLSPEVLEIFEVPPEETAFDRMIELYTPEGRAVVEAALGGAIQDGQPWDVEVPSLTGRGREIWVRIFGRPVVEDGVVTRMAGAIQDVTARRAAEEERRRLDEGLVEAQRLESLGLLAGGIAHDFNNLLSVIMHYAGFAGEQVAEAAEGPDGERWRQARDDLVEVQRAAERAAELTRRMLEFARREVLHPKVLDLNEVVEQLTPLLARTAGEGIRFATTLVDEPWRVNADAAQLEQILVNLVINARDAMPDGGLLQIETLNVEADDAYVGAFPGAQPGRYVSLRVSDTGIGMDEETRRRALEPFFTTKPPDVGTGLGLASVHGIVGQSGGFLKIYSEVGAGTTIGILLPATDAEVTRPAAELLERAEGGRETILVVEDEAPLREVARRVLSRNGYAVLTAADGNEAVEVAARHDDRIDLLLTDVVLPAMSGREVAAKLEASRPGIAVLFMSGYAQPVLASRGVLDDGVHLVEKPFSEQTLLTKVRELIDDPRAPTNGRGE